MPQRPMNLPSGGHLVRVLTPISFNHVSAPQTRIFQAPGSLQGQGADSSSAFHSPWAGYVQLPPPPLLLRL